MLPLSSLISVETNYLSTFQASSPPYLIFKGSLKERYKLIFNLYGSILSTFNMFMSMCLELTCLELTSQIRSQTGNVNVS